MATNKILPFADTADSGDMLTDAQYASDSRRNSGHVRGIASKELANKAAKQSAAVAAGVGQFVADNQSADVTDSDTPAGLAAKVKAALLAVVNPLLNLKYDKTGGRITGEVQVDVDILSGRATDTAQRMLNVGNQTGRVSLQAAVTAERGIGLFTADGGTWQGWLLRRGPDGRTYVTGTNGTVIESPNLLIGSGTTASEVSLRAVTTSGSIRLISTPMDRGLAFGAPDGTWQDWLLRKNATDGIVHGEGGTWDIQDLRADTPAATDISRRVATTEYVRASTLAAMAGMVQAFAGRPENIPTGWLLCNGAELSRTDYAALFARIGTIWNSGTTPADKFKLPSLLGKFVRGVDIGSTGVDPHGEAYGAVTSRNSTIPEHSHQIISRASAPGLPGGDTVHSDMWQGSGTTQTQGVSMGSIPVSVGTEVAPTAVSMVYIICAGRV